MKKHLQNLERLCVKLQALYGEDDPLVHALRNEWNTRKTTEGTGPQLRWKLAHQRYHITHHIEPQYRSL